jgi:hypothetical protein
MDKFDKVNVRGSSGNVRWEVDQKDLFKKARVDKMTRSANFL